MLNWEYLALFVPPFYCSRVMVFRKTSALLAALAQFFRVHMQSLRFPASPSVSRMLCVLFTVVSGFRNPNPTGTKVPTIASESLVMGGHAAAVQNTVINQAT